MAPSHKNLAQSLGFLLRGSDPLLIISESGAIIESNPAASELFGYQHDELGTLCLNQIIPHDMRGHHQQLVKQAFKRRTAFSLKNSVKAISKDKESIPVELYISFKEINSESIAVVIIRDMSEFFKMESKLGESEKKFRDTFERLPIGLCHVSLSGQFLRTNSQLCKFFGYSESELKKITFQDITFPEDLEEDLKNVEALINGEADSYQMEKRYHCAGGQVKWANLTVRLIRDHAGNPEYFLSVVEDICERVNAENKLLESENKFRTIVETMSDESVVWMSTPGVGEMLYVNEGYERIWGRSRKSLYENPQSFIELVHPDDQERVIEHLMAHQQGDWKIDYRIIRDDGEIRFIHDRGHGVFTDGKLQFLVGLATDITHTELQKLQLQQALRELAQANQKLTTYSRIDPLTGLLNRQAIEKEIEKEFKIASRYAVDKAIVFIDLNQFKQVNDTYGHNIGDKILVQCAHTIKGLVRETDTVGRYGGDEFIAILPNADEHQARQFASKIANEKVVFNDKEVNLSLSMSTGYCLCRTSFKSTKDWIDCADKQMYISKKQFYRNEKASE